jgi:hypothetical protein
LELASVGILLEAQYVEEIQVYFFECSIPKCLKIQDALIETKDFLMASQESNQALMDQQTQ